jgi:hypothetical protein
MQVTRRVVLRWSGSGNAAGPVSDLSAVCRDGSLLWIAGDEMPEVYRLSLSPHDLAYEKPRRYRLGDLVDLPAGPDKEVDVEGMDRDADYLWLVGSHSRTRKRADPGDDQQVAAKLAEVRMHPNRNILVRLPIDGADDDARPVREASSGDGAPRTAALLNGDLLNALSTPEDHPDQHLAPFLTLPGKDNGLDIEGLVIVDDAVLVGLRGPVLRGWAVVLELRPRTHPEHPHRLVLGGEGRGYRKIFLHLDGLGVRDLCRAGDDVLVLAGPTMDLDGPVRLYRWRAGAVADRDQVVDHGDLTVLGELPFGEDDDSGHDHAEGITLLTEGDRPDVLVVYDSPAPARRLSADAVLADVVQLVP